MTVNRPIADAVPKRLIFVFTYAALAMSPIGCKPAPQAEATPILSVFLFDRSTSIPDSGLARALDAAGRLASELVPRDRMVAAWIARESYGEGETFLDVTLPDVPSANEFDPSAVAAKQRVLHEADSIRSSISTTMTALRANPRSKGTDLAGALAKAQDIASPHPRLVVVYSDLIAPLPPAGTLRLDGALVRIIFEPKGTLKEMRARQQKWITALLTAGAADVVIVSSKDLHLAPFRSSSSRSSS